MPIQEWIDVASDIRENELFIDYVDDPKAADDMRVQWQRSLKLSKAIACELKW